MTCKYFIALLYALLLIMLTGNAFAGGQISLSYATGNKTYFSFVIPDDWKVNVGFEANVAEMPDGEKPKPRLITLMPNDISRLWFGMWVPDSVSNMHEATEYLRQFRGFFVDNPVTTKTVESKVNGMDVTTVIGEGERNGEKVDIAVVVFQLTKENMGIAIYIGSAESTKLHRDELNAIVHSIHPAGKFDKAQSFGVSR